MVIQEYGRQQAELEGRARGEALDDLPRTEELLVGVGADEVEVELIGMDLGEKVSAANKVFQIEELVFFEAMNGFHIALVGVRGGRDAHMLAVPESFGKVALELSTIVRLPDQIAERDTVTV